jgi:hypothetical protein
MSKKKLTKSQEERLMELHARIEEEVKFVDVKQYSHNIISCNLRIIAEEFGYNKANEAIDKLGLNSLGWETS